MSMTEASPISRRVALWPALAVAWAVWREWAVHLDEPESAGGAS